MSKPKTTHAPAKRKTRVAERIAPIRAEVAAELRPKFAALERAEAALREEDPRTKGFAGLTEEDLRTRSRARVKLERSALFRCVRMERRLYEWKLALADPSTKFKKRRGLERNINDLWKGPLGEGPAGEEDLTRRLDHHLRTAAAIRCGWTPPAMGPPAAKSFLVSLWPVDALSQRTLDLLDEAAAVWNRSAGKRTAPGRRRKWVVFAELHEALGLGPITPEHAKNVCAPKSRKSVQGRLGKGGLMSH